MSTPDSFLTIANPSKGEYKEKGSRFIGYVFPVSDEDEIKEILKQLKKEHYAAVHVCWAYVLGTAGETERFSDDREPSGSAGRPILRTLTEKNLTFVLMAVVRYFGGKLLGVPGLIHAYGDASQEALRVNKVVEKKVYHVIFQPCLFEKQHDIIRMGKKQQLKCYPDIQDSQTGITLEVPPGYAENLKQLLKRNGYEEWKEIKILYS